MIRATTILATILLSIVPVRADENLIVNGTFEQGLSGWNDFWSRTGTDRRLVGGSATLDGEQAHSGGKSVRIEHTGSQDWSFQQPDRLPVEPGQIYELSGWVRVEGEGDVTLGVILHDQNDKAIDWVYGGRTTRATDGWLRLNSRFVIPRDAASIVPRLIGNGPSTVWFDDVSLKPAGSLEMLRRSDMPQTLTTRTDALKVTFHTEDRTFSVVDRRTEKTWRQHSASGILLLDAQSAEGGFDLELLDSAGMMRIGAEIRLAEDAAEITVKLSAEGEMPGAFSFPAPFVTDPGMFLIMPVNEGISYPVDDETLKPMRYYLYGGHGLCMPWWGATDLEQGVMAIVETADDAEVEVPRIDGRLCPAPRWEPQKGRFGSPRTIRYVFFDSGGYVTMCKRYRQYAKRTGLFKTLARKKEDNPNVDRLIGAVNVWCWDPDPLGICRELQSAGIKRILWSNRAKPEQIRELNEMGILSSRYDIYQDCMNPENFDKLRGEHPDWTTEAWPHDIAQTANGDWKRGWRVKGKDGEWYPCGVLCDRQAVDYARRRIPAELKTHPYLSRFIDTTTASPWRECYHPDHPMTRSESKKFKMDLLGVVSGECGLVCGSETGHDASVPFVHYFEGMLSLGPYRVPDAGRAMAEIVHDVPERVAKFQTGHYYRLPLWELVYHDCVVAQWYWGDYNNKMPSLWERRDLFNALYGTPPMFMFRKKAWQENRDRFVRSYNTATPVARATGYSEMLEHAWLTDDHAVQQTRFANGVTVTVNFGDKPQTLADGTKLGPLSHTVRGLKDEE